MASLQVEKSVRVRPEVPTPTKGSLPLPPLNTLVNPTAGQQGQGAQLVPLQQVLTYKPGWQDLPWPQGTQMQQVRA
jgi:hypothetical protein